MVAESFKIIFLLISMDHMLLRQRASVKVAIHDDIKSAENALAQPRVAGDTLDMLESIDTCLIDLQRHIDSYSTLSTAIIAAAVKNAVDSVTLDAESDETSEFSNFTGHFISLLSARKNRLERELTRQSPVSGQGLESQFFELMQLHKVQLESFSPSTESLALERERLQLEKERFELEKNRKVATDLETPSNSGVLSVNSADVSVKLPKLDFPQFDGNVMQWQEFWQCFDAVIHKNGRLADVEKFGYLKAKLVGEAAASIAGLQQTASNYAEAIRWLHERFGDTQTIIDAHYYALMDISSTGNNGNQLRLLYDMVELHLRSLSALGEDVEHRHFISLLKSKLPKAVLTRLEEQNDGKEWSVASLREAFRKYLSARETVDRQASKTTEFSASWKSNKFDSLSVKQPNRFRSSAQALVSSGQPTRSADPKCIYCKNTHWSDECTRYSTISARKACVKGLCYICLGADHAFQDCKSKRQCFYCGAVSNHHRSLCPQKFSNGQHVASVVAAHRDEDDAADSVLIAAGERVLLQTATTDVRNPRNFRHAKVRLLLDCGSERSYITKKLAEKLDLKAESQEILSVVTFGCERPKTLQTELTTISVLLKDGTQKPISVSIVDRITGNVQRAPVTLDHNFLWSNFVLADTLPAVSDTSEVEFLLGSDYYLEFILPERIEVRSGVYLLGSRLGWILSGRTSTEYDVTPITALFANTREARMSPDILVSTAVDESLLHDSKMAEFWSLETVGIKDDIETNDDKAAMHVFLDTIKFKQGRYYVTWPWKVGYHALPHNYKLALGRFVSLLRRLSGSEELLGKYNTIIEDQLNKGIIEKVEHSGHSTLEQYGLHYIPHHAVITPMKTTTKVRIVYDASAKSSKCHNSLNECLYRGPVILGDLCGLLMRFRLKPVALIADIEKAFLQIGLQENDRDVTRFIWMKDWKKCSSNDNIQIYRFCRVPFGVISSPFLLGATVAYHLDTVRTATAMQIKDNIYVDNVITCVDTDAEAFRFYKEAKTMFNAASMNLREWASNSKEFLALIPDVDKVNSSKIKVLGLFWDMQSDKLCIPAPSDECFPSAFSKRTIMKCLASIFDPLGLFAPVTIGAKVFLQQLWKHELTWDDKLSNYLLEEWKALSISLADISKYSIPRFVAFLPPEGQQPVYDLCCFCDASCKSYATAVYLKVSGSVTTSVNLVFAKARVAPARAASIPRLELLALLIGVRATKFVSSELRLPISTTTIWSDSKCVLDWLSSAKTLPVFVRNRVAEINLSTASFRFIIGAENPADWATRGKSAKELANYRGWWHGPEWLELSQEFWPCWNYTTPDKPAEDVAVADHPVVFYETGLSVNERANFQERLPPFGMEIDRFSSLNKLVRTTAHVLRFIRQTQRKVCHEGPLQVIEIQYCKEMWEKYVQMSSYPAVFDDIINKKKNELVKRLNLLIDENGLIRCQGRFPLAVAPIMSPKLLPRKHKFTELVILAVHIRQLHSGVTQTLSLLRKDYWIQKGRTEVRRVLTLCSICKRNEGGPYLMPSFAPLPKSRTLPSAPFTHVGLDYFGPLHIKEFGGYAKVYVCLFTCMTVRAVHLELINDMSASEFLLCFRRFAARRGVPRQVISDNAKHFKCAKRVIQTALPPLVADSDVLGSLTAVGVDWTFIVEFSPWSGGFYERLIGMVKRALRKSIGRNCLTLSQLHTYVTEAESIINSRPLAYVDDGIPGDQTIISPAHFLNLNPKIMLPFSNTALETQRLQQNRKVEPVLSMWKKGHEQLNQFWKLWQNEYLQGLRERGQYRHKQPKGLSAQVPKEGDVVLIKDKLLPRAMWKIGRIAQLLHSHDNVVRSAKIRLANRKHISRPLSILYPLELTSDQSSSC